MLLPAIATAALGTALLVPLRDNRRGRRATLPAGAAPLRPEFLAPAAETAVPAAHSPKPDVLDDARTHLQPASFERPPGGASLTEPLAALTAFANFFDIRNLWRRSTYPEAVAADESVATGGNACEPFEASPNEVAAPSVVERSFADELASLVGGNRRASFASGPNQESDVALLPRGWETNSSVREPDGETNDRRPEVEKLERDSRTVASDSEVQWHVNAVLESAEGFVVPSAPAQVERIVPLTRLRLRPQATTITWPAMCGSLAATESGVSRAERHALLERFARDIASITSDTIELAYREEDSSGRGLALRVMLRHFPSDGRLLFIEAVRNGSDEERAIAIDGLAAIEARQELTVAFGDRLDALAAKAALAYVGTHARADYRERLAPYADATRIEAILKLLAGIVE